MRKKISVITLILSCCFGLINSSQASQVGSNMVNKTPIQEVSSIPKITETRGLIRNFEAQAQISPDASVLITEKIRYDFGDYNRHGIYRTIPVEYKIEKTQAQVSKNVQLESLFTDKYKVIIDNIKVTDEIGQRYNFAKSYKKGEGGAKYLKIKIGDKDKYVTGERNYIISYRIRKAISFFKKQDEFYWNVTGDEWREYILQASMRINLPEGADEQGAQAVCFTGTRGSKEQDCVIEKKNDRIHYSLAPGQVLKTNQGFTVVAGWEKGFVNPPSMFQQLIWILSQNIGVIIGVLVLLASVFGIVFMWYQKGRDPEGDGTIIARYQEPKGMTPQEMGTIIDERVDQVEIASMIINLAVKGYLKIKELKQNSLMKFFSGKDYELIKLKQAGNELKDYELYFLSSLFGNKDRVKISELKNKFYKHLPKIKQQIYDQVVADKYFDKDPSKTRIKFIGLGAVLAIFGVIFAITVFKSIVFGFLLGISGVLWMIFSGIMPRKTKQGVKMKEHALGLKEYLQVAEADRLKFHNAPEKKPEIFEKLLPFAMIFKVERQWAQQFKDIYQNRQPSWYEGQDRAAFNSVALVHSLGAFQKTSNATMASSPSSSAGSGGSGFSGGSSGGGFGGGGGGSW
ncbi:MAG: DUF2207 domain-containing protein [Candidatus Moranbacteria bacterium]|nr:DUF2207 domain-containing protein [Candidatus Moranbacteria bacterium]